MNLPSQKTIKSEFLTHISVNTHPEPKKVAVINEMDTDGFTLYGFEITVEEELKDKYDIIISEQNENFLYEIAALKSEGIAIYETLGDLGHLKEFMEKLESHFAIIMPFFIPYSENRICLFCSKKYHPTSDLLMQRAQMVEPVEYYTPYLQKAAFEQPKYFKAFFGEALKN